MTGIALIGYGYWGPNLARNIANAPGARLVGISDLSPERQAAATERFPQTRVTGDYQELLRDPAVDAVVVATPISTHYPLALEALQAGKHVMVEKPITASVAHAEELIAEAERRGLTLAVDHTFLFTGAVRAIKGLIDRGELGKLLYYNAVRANLGLFQRDVSAAWDLAVHDLAILGYLSGEMPSTVSATGCCHVEGYPENDVRLNLFYPSGLTAHLHVSWLSPIKIRRVLIGGAERMVVYDDMEPVEKVKLYDCGVTLEAPTGPGPGRIAYRNGEARSVELEAEEALAREMAHFAACVEGRERPLSDGRSGLAVVRILEAATLSVARRGEPKEVQ